MKLEFIQVYKGFFLSVEEIYKKRNKYIFLRLMAKFYKSDFIVMFLDLQFYRSDNLGILTHFNILGVDIKFLLSIPHSEIKTYEDQMQEN